jgi:hypothetical protein
MCMQYEKGAADLGNIKVSDAHSDHYIRLDAWTDTTAVWWDGFTGLTVVVSYMPTLRGAINSTHLVAVIDRHSQQTWAWAFDALTDPVYVAEKIPQKTFNKVWRHRLGSSVALMLRLHEQLTRPKGAVE